MPTQLNYSLAGLEGEGLALALDMQGVAIASGAACVTQNLAIPPALAAIGLDAAQAKGNVLLSLGRDTTAADIEIEVPASAGRRPRRNGWLFQ